MRTLPPPQSDAARRSVARRTLSVCVVDAAVDDYQTCVAAAEEAGVRLQLVRSAADALRLSRSTAIDLWIVNANLPGLSGSELCNMLRSRPGRHQVHLVADEYSTAAEQAAFRSRATLFACKAPHLEWLRDWLRSVNLSVSSCSSAAAGAGESP